MKADGNIVDSKTINLMSIEEKRMDDLHVDILRLKTQNISQRSPLSEDDEEDDDTLTPMANT